MTVKTVSKPVVFVGMSGGVDSSVSAALLKEQGFNVVGIFIKIEVVGDCTWRLERRAAFAVAAALDIPLYMIDLSKEYEEAVMTYLLSEYKAGRTPNPDVLCNQTIKFGAFYNWAISHGADYVATGHYAKIKNIHGKSHMAIPTDKEKDQTYFLWAIDRIKLSKVLFPLGDLKKNKVRTLAKRFNLPNATKPDSQGLCFVGDFNFKEFLQEKIGTKSGKVLDEGGRELGTHDGAYLYTIGERHGFSLVQKSNDEKPYYVIAKDIKNNTLIVSHEKLSGTSTKVGNIILEKINWLIENEPETNKPYQARLRHRGGLIDCHLEKTNKGDWLIVFEEEAISPAPGQSIVIYEKEICLGGGIIK